MKIKVLIVEDEMPSARKLKTFLGIIAPDFKVVDILDTVTETVEYLNENSVDLLFLDIHLADGNGFEIFNQIEVKIPVIFTTAYNEYAIDAFRQMSIDYLLKPLDKERLKMAVEKYRKLHKLSTEKNSILNYGRILDMLSETIDNKKYKDRFMVHFRDKIKTIAARDIASFFSENKAVFMMTHSGETYDLSYTLEQLEQELNPNYFFRANRQCIVSIDTIAEAVVYSRSKLKLIVKPSLPFDIIISTEKSTKFKKWLGKL